MPALSPTPTPVGRGAPRVLIVDDSAVARAVLSQLVTASGRFAVAAALGNVAAAMAYLAVNSVDIILLDIAMPGTDGLTALPGLIAAGGGARVVVVSSAAGAGASATVQALALGAADTLSKPGSLGGSSAGFGAALIETLDRLAPGAAPAVVPLPAVRPPVTDAAAGGAPTIVAIGASTGGIHALSQLLCALPTSFRAPILVTQHLPASFMPYFAAQLTAVCGRPAEVATDRMRILPGRLIVAPGDAHLGCVALPDGGAAIRLSRARAASGCLPSVDPMLATIAAVFGAGAVAVMLSGMGRDGMHGARAIAAAGGAVLAQDQASSVVWGMPGGVADIAEAVLPPAALGKLIGRRGRA